MSRLAQSLAGVLGALAESIRVQVITGGCISAAFRVHAAQRDAFVKTGAADALPMFKAEAAGLAELRHSEAVRVPEVLAVGTHDDGAFLALEWIDLAPGTSAAEHELGERLATLHRTTGAQFGWRRDNTIGSTRQQNAPLADWVEFWRVRRLRPQLDLAAERGADGRVLERGRRLLELMPAYFTSHRPVPSLLHGDLWGGNWAMDAAHHPVLFDPAVYYGDREVDLAMTRLFGGFGTAFYSAYQTNWPLDAAAGYRRDLYNLYHVLNHYNLFGGGYLSQARAMIERLLAELGH